MTEVLGSRIPETDDEGGTEGEEDYIAPDYEDDLNLEKEIRMSSPTEASSISNDLTDEDVDESDASSVDDSKNDVILPRFMFEFEDFCF